MGNPLNLPLERQLVSIFAANRENSYGTQRKRSHALLAAARHLHQRFGLEKWENLKEKHVASVIQNWVALDRGCRDVDQKLSHLRWLVRKIGKANLVPRSNAKLGIEPGPRYTRAGKVLSIERVNQMIAAVPDPRIRMMMHLARYFGLRFKESCLFRPGRDGLRDRIWIKRGTKGGNPRYVWLQEISQTVVLEEARVLAKGDQCLIPPGYPTYEKWRQYAYRVLRAAGVSRAADEVFHDLRRTYISDRMIFLVKYKGMDPGRAAACVAREVGHHRTEILRWYLAESEMPAKAV